MLVYILVVLCICSSLASEQDSPVHNPCPCMPSATSDAYKDFLRKHVRADAPATLDQNQWQAFIRNIGTCNRPVQSFLPFALKNLIDNVCSASGGKIYHSNLCISKQEFTFTTVYMDNNCILKKVLPEKKYIILACDELQGYCHPVHFEANSRNDTPSMSSPDCTKPNCKKNFEANPKSSGPNPIWTDHEGPDVQDFGEIVCPAMGLVIITVLSAVIICTTCLFKSKKKREEYKK